MFGSWTFCLEIAQSPWNYTELLQAFLWYSRNFFFQGVSLCIFQSLKGFWVSRSYRFERQGFQDHTISPSYPIASLSQGYLAFAWLFMGMENLLFHHTLLDILIRIWECIFIQPELWYNQLNPEFLAAVMLTSFTITPKIIFDGYYQLDLKHSISNHRNL